MCCGHGVEIKMRKPIEFFAVGIPRAQPRARAARIGKFTRVYNPSDADDWKTIVRNAAIAAQRLSDMSDPEPWSGPLYVNLVFYFPRPKGHFNKKGLKSTAPVWHTSKPDRDNLEKAVLDALVNAGVISDDKSVCAGGIQKLYGNPRCGCFIIIAEANQ